MSKMKLTLGALIVGVVSALAVGCNGLVGYGDDYVPLADGGIDGTFPEGGNAETGADVGIPVDAPPDVVADTYVGDTSLGCTPEQCPTGCCDSNQKCQPSGDSTCGTNGKGCAACSASQACKAGSCVAKCDSTTCATGCCDSNGVCQAGNVNSACGTNGAACGPCTGTNVCASNKCGCKTSADCPVGQACDVAAGTCGNACVVAGTTLICNTGCCDLGTNKCVPVKAGGQFCGANDGKTCTNCAGSSSGHVCELGGSCGCNVAGDCPSGQACNTSTHVCSATCAVSGTTYACNGGCCDAAGTGQCVGGGATGQCGLSGGLCINCATQPSGHVCEANGSCGCGSTTDCPANTACNAGTCTTSCSASVACNGGCCSNGTCTAGTADGACGRSGGACITWAAPYACGGGACVCNDGLNACGGNVCGSATNACGKVISCGNCPFGTHCCGDTCPKTGMACP